MFIFFDKMVKNLVPADKLSGTLYYIMPFPETVLQVIEHSLFLAQLHVYALYLPHLARMCSLVHIVHILHWLSTQ